MRRNSFGVIAILGLLAVIAPSACGAPLVEWEIHDSLGHAWSDELLYFDLKLNSPTTVVQPLAVTNAEGRAWPVQILDRKLNDRGEVVAVRLAMICDLAPFAQRRFQLHAKLPEPANTDLSVTQDGDRWILRTSKLGLAIPAGEGSWAAGEAIANVPPPILALAGADERWVGKGWWTGSRKVFAWKSELLADGPVLAWVRIAYDFGDGRNYTVDIRLPAGQPVALVDEERNLPDTKEYVTDPDQGDAFHLALASGLKPTHAWSKRGLQAAGMHVEPGAEFGGTYLTPAQMHYVPGSCSAVAAWHDAGDNAPVIGLFARFLSHWNRPHDTFVPLVWDAQQGLTARFFLNHGRREWAVMAGTKDGLVVPHGISGEGKLDGYCGAQLLLSKWGQTPLDKVKDWVLDWGDERYAPGRAYVAPDRKRGTMPYFAEQFLLGGQHWFDTAIHVHQTWTGEGDAWAKHRELVAKLPEDKRLASRAAAAFVAYKQTDPDYWPAGNWIGPSNPNMIFMGNAATLMGALTLPDHPKAQAWVDRGLSSVRKNLVNSSSADGAWIECPGYDGAGIEPIVRAALDLHRTGLGDLLDDGRLLKIAMYHANLVTPPDPRTGGLRHLPEFGDCFDLAADPSAKRGRPLFWKMLLPIWQETHPREANQIRWSLGDKTAEDPLAPIDGRSRQVAGFGSVFRHAFNTPDESYLAVHQDSFGYGHYHFDLGALYLFAKGAPLCTDWPSMYKPQLKEAWYHNAVSIDRAPRYAYKGRVTASALLPGVDYSRSRVYYDADHPPPAAEAEPAELPTHCWQRQVLWVKKPGPEATAYVVVRDEVDDTKPTEWNLWTLSDKLKLESRRAEVAGTYGVDMTVQFFVGPDETPTTERLGFGKPSKNAKSTSTTVSREYVMQQNVVRMSSQQGGRYGAVLYPYRPNEKRPQISAGEQEDVAVTGTDNDLVLVYPQERSVTVGDVSFIGQAAIVTRAAGRAELHLAEGRSLNLKQGYGLAGRGPASMTIVDGQPLEIHTAGEERELAILLPPNSVGKLVSTTAAKQLKSEPGRLTVRVGSGIQTFLIERSDGK